MEQYHLNKLKKYRSVNYDIYAETFATYMKQYNLPNEFHTFTDSLMDEPKINRNCLLKAIDDYNNCDELCKEFPLPKKFYYDAYNFFPYQPCVFC